MSLPVGVSDAVADGVMVGVGDAVSVLVALSLDTTDALLAADGTGAVLADADAEAAAVETATAVAAVEADALGTPLAELSRVAEDAGDALADAPREGVGSELIVAAHDAETLLDALCVRVLAPDALNEPETVDDCVDEHVGAFPDDPAGQSDGQPHGVGAPTPEGQ